MITAPPGQVWVSGDAVVSSGPWFLSRPESFPGEPANNTYLCEQDTRSILSSLARLARVLGRKPVPLARFGSIRQERGRAWRCVAGEP